jgi:hypothetical protein
MRLIAAAVPLLLTLLARPASAMFLDVGALETVGNENYRGEYGYVDFGDNLHLRPTFSAYHDDFSSGTYKTLAARLAYDTPGGGFGIYGGGTPEVNDYSNRFYGADALISFATEESAPAPKRDVVLGQGVGEDLQEDTTPRNEGPSWGLARVDLGAGVTRTLHAESFTPSIIPTASSGSVTVGQIDYRGTVRLLLLRSYFTVDVTESRYDHALSDADTEAQVQNLAGLDANIQGFPDTSVSARVDLSMVPLVTPYGSYTHTTFELSQPSLRDYMVGLYFHTRYLRINGSYQRLVQQGQPTLNLTSVGVTVHL